MARGTIATLEGRHRAMGGNALRAAVPVLSLFVTHGLTATIWSGILSAAALAAVGVGTSFFTGRSALFSAGRQIAIGALAAAVTFGMGALFGVALAG
jgi:VIT1/CCC1 family predicted Fe2+/Mn2+ transporter